MSARVWTDFCRKHRPAPILQTVTLTVAALEDIARQAQDAAVESAEDDPDTFTYASGVRDLAAHLAGVKAPRPRLAGILCRRLRRQ